MKLRVVLPSPAIVSALPSKERSVNLATTPGARAVGDPEAQHRRLEVVELGVAGAVGLAGELGRGVEVARRRDRGFLVDLLLWAVAVDPGGRAVDDAADFGPAGGLEHVQGAARVDLLGEDRVGQHV